MAVRTSAALLHSVCLDDDARAYACESLGQSKGPRRRTPRPLRCISFSNVQCTCNVFQSVTVRPTSQVMLPNLSNKCKLQLLIPVSIEPAWMSARRQALLELKTIVDVRVSSRSGKGMKALYTVEVFRNSVENESPISMDTGGRPLKAAVRTEKTLGDFGLLRGDIYDTAWAAHNDVHCEFCAELVDFYVLGSANPEALTLRLLGEERALRKLTKLLNDLLTLTVRNSSVDGRNVCSGQAHIPQMLYNFLFGIAPEEAQAA